MARLILNSVGERRESSTKKNNVVNVNTLSGLAAQDRHQLMEAASLPVTGAAQIISGDQDIVRDGQLVGLDEQTVLAQREIYGENKVSHNKRRPAIVSYLSTFVDPFILILLLLGAVMFVTDVILADEHSGPDWTGVGTVVVMVAVSTTLRFWQEYRAESAADSLNEMVHTTVAVTRYMDGAVKTEELPLVGVVPGDIIRLAAGDMVPGDVRLLQCTELQINQSTLTGEALPVEKFAAPEDPSSLESPLEAKDLAFMGTSVVSGSGAAVVIHTGPRTYFGNLSGSVTTQRPQTSFDRGISEVTKLLIRFMCIMVPIVFILNGLTKDWWSAFLFAITTAVGLTPEMLPLVVTANLSKGAQVMAKHRVIVKRLNSIQDFGAMDVLCTDKTGTLTEDRVVLSRYVDTDGKDSFEVLQAAYTNASLQTGLRNLIDREIIEVGDEHGMSAPSVVVDEVPFDFQRRRLSVVVGENGQHVMVTKGAVEEMLTASTAELWHGQMRELTDERREEVRGIADAFNVQGMRVIAVAVRVFPENPGAVYTSADECDMTLLGFLAFLDPPKASAPGAIKALTDLGVDVKVITGDSTIVAVSVCEEVGIDVTTILTGPDVEGMSDEELAEAADHTHLFSKVSPTDKGRIVQALRSRGHVVGFLGDGINDAAALRCADVGISVDSATDIAKESADIILLEKDLGVLENGVVEGRRTFVNTMKYIKITVSSNFGNMFSILVASAFLPFLPMLPVVVLVQNLASDLSMMAMPWDRVDREELTYPRVWETQSLSKFMLYMGPTSSIFDITTFGLMWFVFAANTVAQAPLFQSGWFVESIISQVLVVHMLRTRKIPFVQSWASVPVILSTAAVCVFGLWLPFSVWGHSLGLVDLPVAYFPWLVVTLVAYCLLAQATKVYFIKRFNVWI